MIAYFCMNKGKVTKGACSHPRVGQEEELLKERDESYRYLVHGNYKIIYSTDTEHEWIKIADMFDTGQNPMKMKRNI